MISRSVSIKVVMFLVLLIGFGGYYQALTSNHLYCDDVGGIELKIWFGVCILQIFLYLAAANKNTFEKIYIKSQILTMPFLLIVIYQLLSVYASSFLSILTIMTIPVCIFFIFEWLIKDKHIFYQNYFHNLIIFLWLFLTILSTLVLWILYSRNIKLTNFNFFFLMIFSIIISILIVINFIKKEKSNIEKKTAFLPISILIMVLLGAKNPDGSYDSLLYKGVQPLLLADWRSALTGAIDHTLLGTNHQEIINAILRIIDSNYSPSLISTLAYISLWVILPYVLWVLNRKSSIENKIFWERFIALAIFCLTESLIASGTTNQEPLMVLFMVLSLLPNPLGWLFFTSAMAVKITVIYVLPMFLLLHYRLLSLTLKKELRYRFLPVSINLLIVFIGFFIISSHLYRNFEYTGRILTPSNMFASLTDPSQKILINQANTLYDIDNTNRGGIIDNFLDSSLNIFLFDQITPVTYKNSYELGFHYFPSSRWPLIGLLLSFTVLIIGIFRGRPLYIVVSLAFISSYLSFLNQMVQGRYFIVLSFSSITFFIILLDIKKSILEGMQYLVLSSFFTFIIGSDLFAGISSNASLEAGLGCPRKIFKHVEKANLDIPESEIDKKIKEIAKIARQLKPTHIPTIIGGYSTERKRYLGVSYIYSPISIQLNNRYLAVDKNRYIAVPDSVVALILKDGKSFNGIENYIDMSNYIKYYEGIDGIMLVSTRFLNGKTDGKTIIKNNLGFFEFFSECSK